MHIGEREHVVQSVFVYLNALYPRTWSARRVLAEATAHGRRFAVPRPATVPASPRLVAACDSPIAALARHTRQDTATTDPAHLFTLDDAHRYSELEALILHAALPSDAQSSSSSSSSLLQHVLQQSHHIPLHTQGEKMFKSTLSRMLVEMLPALSPVAHTQVTHKAWGRTNLERMYEALRIARIQERVGGTPVTTKDGRAYLMRNLFFELIVATEAASCAAPVQDASDAAQPPQTPSATTSSVVGGGGDALSGDVGAVLGAEILRRLSFELIFSSAALFMNRAEAAVECLEFPTVDDLARWNSV
jgi:hypothetical protein